MNKVLVISPHYDDAILSAGQFMAGRPDAEVITVFGGLPPNPKVQTTYDAKCGFENAEKAVYYRQLENDAALALLQATAINFRFVDSQYGVDTTVDDIADELQAFIYEKDYDFILAPLGLGHPDHEKVSNAVLLLNTDMPIYLWEDLPLRVIEPDLAAKRLKQVGVKTKLESPGSGDIAKKIRSLLCYKSQIGTGILDPYIMFVPERFWRIKELGES